MVEQRGKRGFAAMDPEEQREIASRGGRASHQRGNAHEFDSEEAAEAGRKGGEAVSRDRAHMAEIGAKGGRASHHGNAAFHHESAAHHHRQAARHHASGDVEEADRHTRAAHTHSQTAHEHSQRGFAAMDPEEHREISRKGGKASHGGRGRDADNEIEDEGEDEGRRGGTGNGRRGFAAMDPEERREIARKGGQASHGGRARDAENDEEEDEGEDEGRSNGSGNGRRGFAAMDPEERREIARKGGLASHGGRGRNAGDDEEDEDAEPAGTRGGSSAQHAKAGRQSHKNG